jgi:hypothetical protein
MVYTCCHAIGYDCKSVVGKNVCFIKDFVHVIKCEKEIKMEKTVFSFEHCYHEQNL